MQTLIYQIILGGLLGAIGQWARSMMGKEKLMAKKATNAINALNGSTPQMPDTEFSQYRFWGSLSGGFVAGALCCLFIVSPESLNSANKELPKVLASIIAAGYAGVDFIEGIFKKFIPAAGGTALNAQKNKADDGGAGNINNGGEKGNETGDDTK